MKKLIKIRSIFAMDFVFRCNLWRILFFVPKLCNEFLFASEIVMDIIFCHKNLRWIFVSITNCDGYYFSSQIFATDFCFCCKLRPILFSVVNFCDGFFSHGNLRWIFVSIANGNIFYFLANSITFSVFSSSDAYTLIIYMYKQI